MIGYILALVAVAVLFYFLGHRACSWSMASRAEEAAGFEDGDTPECISREVGRG